MRGCSDAGNHLCRAHWNRRVLHQVENASVSVLSDHGSEVSYEQASLAVSDQFAARSDILLRKILSQDNLFELRAPSVSWQRAKPRCFTHAEEGQVQGTERNDSR